MLIKKLTLCDFGLFQGQHEIDLAPRQKYGATRPIVLFGGLNGAGKTTILTAIRLAIYGRQAIGYGTTQKAYEEYLNSKIHRVRNALVEPSGAHVILEFIYYKLGTPIKYEVRRSWVISGKQIKETLTIFQDGKVISDFTSEQCQAFLNELIPLGVSDLFFFDGEKIASLAEDGGDVALRDAIRKLLGLDIIERLKSDLHLYVRRQTNNALPEDSKAQLEQLDTEYKQAKERIQEAERKAAQEIRHKIAESEAQLYKLEESLASKGGAWAVSRGTLKNRREQLITKKKALEAEVRDALNELYPLSLASKLLSQLNSQINLERQFKEWDVIATAITQRIETLKTTVKKYVPEVSNTQAIQEINHLFQDLTVRPDDLKNVKLVHDLSSKDYGQLEAWIHGALTTAVAEMKARKTKLHQVDEELANISVQIDRAPDESALKADLDAIKKKNTEIVTLKVEHNHVLEQGRRETWKAIELVRKMRKLEEALEQGSDENVGVLLAKNSREVLADFSSEMTKRKIEKLEQEFAATFSRLARKDDAIVSAKIDPANFEVHLSNKKGQSIPKNDLSAGEKQIYAIAMLEALAHTSGRKLPIIIDTPLGRLDSHHRGKLVDNYFPRASHQVIILSTDTEVDAKFYQGLSSHISHSYHIRYDAIEGCSSLEEGYFWKSLDNEEGAHVA
ncbi:ATPase involved in DNA repair [Sulfuricella denitrificans skB26]|uniref:ATPase involved in DNA repair n=1 Tax=Sulfuricella denitrificans (strain DSM 22764 / NBRC 105220 / skB26) TaxID=1163617 RepID=S6B2L4_SULDS|nr:DNA sulfur modification protein DndD [Sulfuricella denitrificans]BAN34917.1 ATPase involved in DNA repair [Sulfuricella denitrificans skB26]